MTRSKAVLGLCRWGGCHRKRHTDSCWCLAHIEELLARAFGPRP